jgi:sulfotransferase famil protein
MAISGDNQMISTDIKSLKIIAQQGAPRQIGASLMTTVLYPLYYRPITKCGSTFCLNLLYFLQYEHIYSDPRNVRGAPLAIPNAQNTPNETITDSPYSFVIIRDPVKRFISLYFDKLYGAATKSDPDGFGAYFIETGLVDPTAGTNILKHRENCKRSIQWIKKNLKGETDQKIDYHWKPQRYRLNQIREFKFNVLMLVDIDYQLDKILNPLIPHIADAIQAVSAQNISKKPVCPEDILDQELRQMIAQTYFGDMKLYEEVSSYWRNLKEEH